MLSSFDFLTQVDQIPDAIFLIHFNSEFLLPAHTHEKGQLIYIQGGVAYIHLVDKTLVIPARHYVWIPKKVQHFISMDKSVKISSLYFFVDENDSQPFFNKGGIYPMTPLLSQMLTYAQKWNGNVTQTDSGFQFLSGIKSILPDISKKALPIVLPTTDNQRMTPVLKYMQSHLFETLTLVSVCRETGFSQRTLTRLFKETMSISFLQYFKLLKMIKAIEMMLETENSLSEIAYILGYNSVSSFSNIFFELTKIRPSEFEKQLKG